MNLYILKAATLKGQISIKIWRKRILNSIPKPFIRAINTTLSRFNQGCCTCFIIIAPHSGVYKSSPKGWKDYKDKSKHAKNSARSGIIKAFKMFDFLKYLDPKE